MAILDDSRIYLKLSFRQGVMNCEHHECQDFSEIKSKQ